MPAGAQEDPRVAELIEIHREAIGGRNRIAALTSLRASGQVTAGGTKLGFSLTAARPNLIRLETGTGARTRLQGFDGVGPAWEKDSGASGRPVRPMAPAAAKTFVTDAEFDDPLIGGGGRGYAFDFAGEQEREGRRYFRLLVTRNLTETFSLLVDATTYLVVSRMEQRLSAGGRKVPVVTEWSDFRPVAGVLLAHKIVVTLDGRPVQETQITEIEANPALAAESFRPPEPPATAPAGS